MSQFIPEVPGRFLERKFMIPNGLSQNKLAREYVCLDMSIDILHLPDANQKLKRAIFIAA